MVNELQSDELQKLTREQLETLIKQPQHTEAYRKSIAKEITKRTRDELLNMASKSQVEQNAKLERSQAQGPTQTKVPPKTTQQQPYKTKESTQTKVPPTTTQQQSPKNKGTGKMSTAETILVTIGFSILLVIVNKCGLY